MFEKNTKIDSTNPEDLKKWETLKSFILANTKVSVLSCSNPDSLFSI